jgi:hypothetical protein
VGSEYIWFRSRVLDSNGRVIISGQDNMFIATGDLPELIAGKLAPGESIELTKSVYLDRWLSLGSRVKSLPGKYKISGVYRFEPDKETDGAGMYRGESREQGLWTGMLYSEPVAIEITPQADLLTAAVFKKIQNHVLTHGDRETYCNMYNNNPHLLVEGIDIYLNPENGQENMNCEASLSKFDHMVLRRRKQFEVYHRLKLNTEQNGPELVMQYDTKPEEVQKCFEEILAGSF